MLQILCFLSILLCGLGSCGGASRGTQKVTWNIMHLMKEIEATQQKGHLTEALVHCQGQRIEVVGFLHKTKEGQFIMTSQAVIKSCCLTNKKQYTALFVYPKESFNGYSGLCHIEGRFQIALCEWDSLETCISSLWECQYKN